MSNGVPYSQALPPGQKEIKKKFYRYGGGVYSEESFSPRTHQTLYGPKKLYLNIGGSGYLTEEQFRQMVEPTAFYETQYVRDPAFYALSPEEQKAKIAEFEGKVSAAMPETTPTAPPVTSGAITTLPIPPGFDPAKYATEKGYTKYFQKEGVWYGRQAGVWKATGSKEEARALAGLVATAPATTPSALGAPTGFGPSSYTGVSIVDYLKSVGQASDYPSRAKLAQQYGITNYTGSATQNTQLLSMLRGVAPSVAPKLPPPVDPNEQARIDAANEANKNAKTIFDNLPKDGDVAIRDSAKLLADIEAKLELEAPPAPPSLMDLFTQEKAKLGIEPLETELAGIDANIDRIQAQLLVQAEEAGERIVSTAEIGRAKGALQKRADREIALLNVERSAVARQLSNKLSTLEIVMNLTGQDYANTSDYYEKNFNRTIQIYNLVAGVEEREYTRAEDAERDARANWDIVTNAMKEGGISYGDLTSDQQFKLRQFEIQAGLPEGLSEKILMSVDPGKEIVSKIVSTDKSMISILYDDGYVETFATGLPVSPKPPKKLTEPEKKRKAIQDMSYQLNMVKGDDGFVSPEDWKIAKNGWVSEGLGSEDFIEEFFDYINPYEPGGVKEYGIREASYFGG